MLTAIFAPMLIHKKWPTLVDPANWWTALLPAAIGVTAYLVSLNSAAAQLGPRRERLLATVEGKD
jgi:hypothetical protein